METPPSILIYAGKTPSYILIQMGIETPSHVLIQVGMEPPPLLSSFMQAVMETLPYVFIQTDWFRTRYISFRRGNPTMFWLGTTQSLAGTILYILYNLITRNGNPTLPSLGAM